MPHAEDRRGDGLAVDDAALAEAHVQAEAIQDQAAQHLELDLAHQLHMDLSVALVPDDAQHRVLLLKLAEFRERAVRVRAVGQDELIGQHRLQERRGRLGLGAEAETDIAVAQARDGDDAARARLLERTELDAGVEAQLIGLFAVGAALCFIGERGFYAQRPARDLQPRQARALRVA